MQQYLISLYYSLLMLKPNEVGPRSNMETMTCAVIMIMDLSISGLIFGNVAVYVQMAQHRNAKLQKDIDNANNAMKDMSIPKSVQDSVTEFMQMMQATREQQEDMRKFYELISPSLKQRVAVSIFTDILQQNAVLSNVVKFHIHALSIRNKSFQRTLHQSKGFKNKVNEIAISLIVSNLTTELKKPEDEIIHQFEATTDMYLVGRGECVVNFKNEEGVIVRNHCLLHPSDYFGEIALVYGCKRTASVFSSKYSTVAKLTKPKFKEITSEFPELLEALKGQIYNYTDSVKTFALQCLQRVEFLEGISVEAMHEVLYGMDLHRYAKGQVFNKLNDSELLFLQNGLVEVYMQLKDHDFVIDRLYPGAVINFRNWFMEDNWQVRLRFGKNSVLQVLPLAKFQDIGK